MKIQNQTDRLGIVTTQTKISKAIRLTSKIPLNLYNKFCLILHDTLIQERINFFWLKFYIPVKFLNY